MMLQSFGQVRATMLRPGIRTTLIFNTQHLETRRNGVVCDHVVGALGMPKLL